jgi:hypothetical protein
MKLIQKSEIKFSFLLFLLLFLLFYLFYEIIIVIIIYFEYKILKSGITPLILIRSVQYYRFMLLINLFKKIKNIQNLLEKILFHNIFLHFSV